MQLVLAMLVALALMGACKSPLDHNIGERSARPEEAKQDDTTIVTDEQKAVPEASPAPKQLLTDDQAQR